MKNKIENKKNVKKKKISFKKIKKLFAKIGQAIVDKVKALCKKFKALPDTTKHIVYVWSVILVVIIVLIIVSSSNNDFLKDYQNLEKSMNNGALDYVKTNELYPGKDNKLKLDLDFLLEDNYVYEDEVKDKSCYGFALVHYNDEEEDYVVSSYINCDKYTTEGFSDYK